jgi:hypothetical protein
MHKGRITVGGIAALGIIALLFPWVEVSKSGMEAGFVFDFGMETWYGFQLWYGQLAAGIFAVIALAAVIGKKENMIAKGFPKMTILVASGLLLLEGLLILVVAGMSDKITAEPGIYVLIFAAVLAAIAPYVFKADGTVHVPEIKDVMDDIEDSADIVEDKAEEIADKIEDKFDGDDDDNDKEEKKEEPKEASSDDKAEEA